MRQVLILLSLPGMLLGPGWAGADDDGEDAELARRLRQAGEIVAAQPLVEDARHRRPGKLLEIELEREEGRYVYEIEMVDGRGRVWEYFYDAATGRFLREKLDE